MDFSSYYFIYYILYKSLMFVTPYGGIRVANYFHINIECFILHLKIGSLQPEYSYQIVVPGRTDRIVKIFS